MKASVLGLCFLTATVQWFIAPQKQGGPPASSRTNAEREIVSLSSDKWRWNALSRSGICRDRETFLFCPEMKLEGYVLEPKAHSSLNG